MMPDNNLTPELRKQLDELVAKAQERLEKKAKVEEDNRKAEMSLSYLRRRRPR